MIRHIQEHPRAKEAQARLPIKKRKLRDNSYVKSINERPRQNKKLTQQVATNPSAGRSATISSDATMDAIIQDINQLLCSGIGKSNRKKRLKKTKKRWRTELGMSKVQFSNGVWHLARNKANVQIQFENKIILNSPLLVDEPRDATDSSSSISTESSTNTILDAPFTVPDTNDEDDTKVLGMRPAVDQEGSWINLFHPSVWGLGTSMWG
ncbi:unnamed protein product [Cylindrotheca closterium]|uniref:Uncharacterized protein n=1 Tax=Cylindrotheca closterium TaxID=2856 RepID=A0AAD2PVC9_9STRA|nr:unnamed protein product [Cylindrotheca closterium]